MSSNDPSANIPAESSAASSASPPTVPATIAPVTDALAPTDTGAAAVKPIVVHMPVDVRSVSLALLTLFGSIVLLRWASAVLIPLVMSVILTQAFAPPVEWLYRRGIPRLIGAAVLLLGLMSALVGGAYVYSDDAAQLVASLPVAAKKMRETLQHRAGVQPTANPIDTVQLAATQLEQAARENSARQTPPGRGVMRVLIERPPFDVRDYLWIGTVGLLGMFGQTTVVLFLTYFALASGDTFRRKMVKIAGSSLRKKRITVQVLDEITAQVQRYLVVQLVTSVIVGVLTWIVFWALGLEHAAVWGIASGVLNLIPYIGSSVVTAGSALVAFLQFGTVNMALAVGGASVLIHLVIGNLLTPWLTSRASRMSPVVVFISILAWGWLWGIWGLLLGIPIMMAVKAICDRVEDLKPVGELLGG